MKWLRNKRQKSARVVKKIPRRNNIISLEFKQFFPAIILIKKHNSIHRYLISSEAIKSLRLKKSIHKKTRYNSIIINAIMKIRAFFIEKILNLYHLPVCEIYHILT